MLNKVLVVDDSELIHNMYRMILKKYEGCEVITVKNGREALNIIADEKNIDLILLDINMPVMNGLEFLKIYNKGKGNGRIPVIIISTEGKEEDTLRGLSLGAKGYIVKPFKSIMLHDLIESVMRAKET